MCLMCPTVKHADTKSYIRLDGEGTPELIRILPVIGRMGMPDPELVAIHHDEQDVKIVPRWSVEGFLTSLGCIPLEYITHYKHTKVH